MKTTLLHVTLVVFCLYSAEALGGQTIASNGRMRPIRTAVFLGM